MDWLRRNWPDLLIGIALVAVIAGIIATLITGGSFFTIGQPERTTPQVAPPPDAVAPVAVPEVPEPQLGEPTPPVTEAGPEAEVGEGPTVAVLPPSNNNPPAPAPVAAEPPTPEVVAPAPAPVVAEPPEPPPVQVEPPTPSSDQEAPFRVSVGAFSTAENAERQADIFRAAGFPVLIGAQDDLSLVLVGPFDTQAEAEAAAAQVRQAGLFEDPLIYTFEPDEEPVAVAPVAAPPTPAPAPTPPAEGRFLQVGAYASAESAEPQRQRLASLGFAVTDRVENGLVKLLIGPFGEAELVAAQTRLEAEGIESFPR